MQDLRPQDWISMAAALLSVVVALRALLEIVKILASNDIPQETRQRSRRIARRSFYVLVAIFYLYLPHPVLISPLPGDNGSSSKEATCWLGREPRELPYFSLDRAVHDEGSARVDTIRAPAPHEQIYWELIVEPKDGRTSSYTVKWLTCPTYLLRSDAPEDECIRDWWKYKNNPRQYCIDGHDNSAIPVNEWESDLTEITKARDQQSWAFRLAETVLLACAISAFVAQRVIRHLW